MNRNKQIAEFYTNFHVQLQKQERQIDDKIVQFVHDITLRIISYDVAFHMNILIRRQTDVHDE